MDTVIRNARVRTHDQPVDIGIHAGRITEVGQRLEQPAAYEIDADGGLVLPSFVEAHTHLDMAFFEDFAPARVEGTLDESIERALTVMKEISKDEVKANARRAVEGFVANGCTKIRTHVCVTEEWEHTGLEAVLEVRDELAELADIQIIAYQFKPGLTSTKYDLLEEAMALGADLVGGRPNTEPTDKRAQEYVDTYFELANRYDAGIDFHVDVTTNEYSRTFEYVAHKTIEEGYEGQVQAGHVCSLPYYNPEHRRKVIRMAKRADLAVVTNPEEDQLINGLDTTSVRELLEAGVNLSIGHNDTANTFHPLGSLDMLEPAWLLLHVVGFNTPDEWETLLDCITHKPARTLWLSDYGLEPGCKADLTVFREPSIRELLRVRSPRRCVLKEGKVVAETEFGRSVVT